MITINKVPIEPLIQILNNLYEEGVDYIDISGENNVDGGELRDLIRITVRPEYTSGVQDVEEIKEEFNKDKNLKDMDINDLI